MTKKNKGIRPNAFPKRHVNHILTSSFMAATSVQWGKMHVTAASKPLGCPYESTTPPRNLVPLYSSSHLDLHRGFSTLPVHVSLRLDKDCISSNAHRDHIVSPKEFGASQEIRGRDLSCRTDCSDGKLAQEGLQGGTSDFQLVQFFRG
mmetsp:Transcript_4161/g.6552  ORF Transcript_4161/g.6552 Transcript_4161/m.6552 type:complete len:148 (+) Transcript_4161:98-541(+)